MPLFQPNNYSGCFLWFQASSITGVANGGTFSNWNDSSGSGNNLKFTSSISFPTYLTNQLNGYPVVSMPGPNGINGVNNFFQLQGSGTSKGLIGISPSSISIYTVYQTASNLGQTLFSLLISSGVGISNPSAISLDVNAAATGSLAASNAWFFSYESGANLTYTVQATNLKQPTNYVLRTDRFTPYSVSGIHFQFGINGANIAASSNPVFNSLYGVNAFLCIGSSYNFSNIFQGKIAEIIAFSTNPPISDYEDSQITNYLLSKYNLNNYGAAPLFMNAPPVGFTPSGLNGLFAWYETANSVTGVSPGGNITSLLDLSGSGNNMIMGSGTPPTYQTNSINGFPTIRFSGGFLFTPTHSQSLEINNSGLSIYSVYRTNNPLSQQSILVNEGIDPSKKRDWRNFSIGINNNNNFGTAPSSWYYSWGFIQASLPINSYVTATNITQPQSQYVIRGDLFSSSGFSFCNFNNLVAASSNTVNTYSGGNSLLYMGYSQYDNSVYLNGDIAEILVFNLDTLSTAISPPYYGQTNLHNIIIDYLDDKYFNPSGINNSISLFTSGSSSISNVTNNIPLYLDSLSTQTNSTTLTISGFINTSTVQNQIPLYVGSTMGQTIPVKLFTGAGSFNSGHFPLYTINIPSGSTSLFIGAGSFKNSGAPLFIGNHTIQYTGSPLYTTGFVGGGQSIPLWTQGNLQQYPPMDLYTKGQQVGAGNITLFIGHTNTVNSGISLFMSPSVGQESGIPPYYITSYIKGQPVPSGIGNIPFFMATTNIIGGSGLYDNSPLYAIGGPSGYQTALPLFLGNNLVAPYPPSGGMPLFISGPIHSGYANQNTTLFVGNYTQQINSQGYQGKLYAAGAGTLNGGLIYQEGMPLFLNVIPITTILPAYFDSDYFGLQDFNLNYFSPASAPFPPSISGLFGSTSMFMFGTFSDFGGINLYTQGLVNSGSVPMFMQAPFSISRGTNMVISGTPIINQSATLYGAGF